VVLGVCCVCGELPRASALKWGGCNTSAQYLIVVVGPCDLVVVVIVVV
jgi:hypothetical protein